MIIKFLLQGVLNLLSLVLQPFNFAINSIIGITWVQNALTIVAYILPWNNIKPIITIIVGMFIFRAIISLIKTIWELIPIL